jgi:hypothetical protein
MAVISTVTQKSESGRKVTFELDSVNMLPIIGSNGSACEREGKELTVACFVG